MKLVRAYFTAYPKFVDRELLNETARHFLLLLGEVVWIIASPLLVLFYVCYKPGAWDRWFFERRR